MYKWRIFLVLLLTGCSATEVEHNTEVEKVQNSKAVTAKKAEQLYLRGTFSMWGYDEEYQLLNVTGRLFSAAAQLQQGKEYEFMFSAKDASKANCGYLRPVDKRLVVGKIANASCDDVVLQNFVFRPVVPGVYEFFIDFTLPDKPKVYVKKAY